MDKGKIICDLDGTITINESAEAYEDKLPNYAVVNKLREYQKLGFKIQIFTSRNMRTHEGNLGKINKDTLPVILSWLEKYRVPYDEIVVGKPWCGEKGFYVDNRALRPDEFTALSAKQVADLMDGEDA